MREMARSAAAAVALLAASPAAAQVSLDLKVAFAIPSGNVWTRSPWNPGVAMSDVWTSSIPIEVAGRWRLNPNTSLGAYFGWGPAFVASGTCASGCGGFDMRTGLVLAYHFTPDRALDPWVSLGTGWQWSQYSGPAAFFGGGNATVTYNGWEYLNVAVGVDLVAAPSFTLGPYVGVVGGTYSNFTGSGAAADYGGSVELSSRSFHAWWQFGLKGSLNL